ncbi:IS30 family transposase [Metamycoplasma alkalescens]|uniref:IS30 family transposase n=1 Tax=Metamycoplasma alkalescens TaxID=45363 RepID=UPI000E3D8335|nr:IS30 family transposase [Metamycoplasma alkalescens]
MNYNKNNKYKHINEVERSYIKFELNRNKSIRSIAKKLDRSPSTIMREIKRNTSLGTYDPIVANIKAKKRHRHKYYFRFLLPNKFDKFTELFKNKYDKKYYGVKATLHEIKKDPNINCPSLRTVYNWINKNLWVIKRKDRLRKWYKKGGKRTTSVIKRLVNSADYVFPIWTRPKKIDLRKEFGHWEADLVLGRKSNGYYNVLTLTERKTRIGFAIKVRSKSGFVINSSLKNLIQDNNLFVKSITIDNGIEFEKIGLLAKWLDIKIYRAEPYASFQRGSNEHWNGILRREFKKGFDFNEITQEELEKIVFKINNMPREILNWLTPLELFKKENSNDFIL